MSYECVEARFLFFNGKQTFTVEYTYGLSTWFVFEDQKTTDAVWLRKINPANHRSPTRISAEEMLHEYFVSINK